MHVIKVDSNFSLDRAITAASAFIDWDSNVVSSRAFKADGITGLALLYKPIYYDDLGDVGDLTTPQDEYDAGIDLHVKYAPTYFFKDGNRLFMFDTAGFNRQLIDTVIKTFRLN